MPEMLPELHPFIMPHENVIYVKCVCVFIRNIIQFLNLGNIDAAQVYLANGADVNASDMWGVTPLYMATAGGYTNNKDLVKMFLNHGADPQIPTDEGETAFQGAFGWPNLNNIDISLRFIEDCASRQNFQNGNFFGKTKRFFSILAYISPFFYCRKI